MANNSTNISKTTNNVCTALISLYTKRDLSQGKLEESEDVFKNP